MIHPCRLLPLFFALPLIARELPALPSELADYKLDPAPETGAPVLKKGDRLAICGDSITEQKLYSVLMETYLTACTPELEITCRQHGWSGEQAGGFLNRIKSDVLRFKPTVATTCYGMNDFRYVPYNEAFAADYRKNQSAVAEAFKGIGCRLVVGSPGIIDSVPKWVKSAEGTPQDLNIALSKFRNIDIQIAQAGGLPFADVYRPMLIANYEAKKQYGPDFKVSGKDGVHPGWAGHVVMAYGFLKGLGVDGDLGSIIYDEAAGKATAANGHEIVSAENGKITVRSNRIPVAVGPGPVDRDDSMRAGMALVPFDDELNRFVLKIVSPKAANYTVTWGATKRSFTAAQLAAGINLAKEFDANPLVEPFAKVQAAVSKKQEYETRQIKNLVHGPEGAADLEATFALTEKAHAVFEKAVLDSRKPVMHEIVIAAAN